MEALRVEVAPFGIHTTIGQSGLLPHRAPHGAVDELCRARPSTTTTSDERRCSHYWKAQNGQQSGDPAKLAQALLTIASQDPPPRRFIAGADAIATAEQKVADLQADIQSNRELSTSLDFESSSLQGAHS